MDLCLYVMALDGVKLIHIEWNYMELGAWDLACYLRIDQGNNKQLSQTIR